MRFRQISNPLVVFLAISLSALAVQASPRQDAAITFNQIAKLVAPDGQTSDAFGGSVAVDGTTIVVGKNGFDPLNTVFVYENSSGTVTQVAELTPSDGLPGDRFGLAVAISGDTIIVSSGHVHKDPQNSGSIYVYVKPAGGWTSTTETAELSIQQQGAGIGRSIGTNGNTVVSLNSARSTADVWVEPSGGWVTSSRPNAELISADGQALTNVAISGNVIVAGSPSAYQFGVVFVYQKPAKGWNKIGITETARLVGSAAGGGGGEQVAISGNTVVTTGNVGPVSGAYVYVKPAGGWVNMNQTAFLNFSNPQSVAVSGNTIVLGTPFQLVGVNPGQGAAFIFEKPAAGWKNTSAPNTELTADDGNINDELGTSVAISGATIVTGAPQAQIGSNAAQGAAYVFASQ